LSADSFRVRESLAFVPAVQYISIMTIDSVNSNGVAPVQEMAAVKTLKNTLQFQEKAAMKLLDSLSVISDPALGQRVDTSA
jgi:hypothetical protein